MPCLAGLCGRTGEQGFNPPVATVFGIGEPGRGFLGFTTTEAGLDGRILYMGFIRAVATVFEGGEPGTSALGFKR